MTPDDILAAARAELGTPFRHQGRIPGKSLDCAGLAIATAARLGIPYIDRPGYSRMPSDGILECTLDDQPALVRADSMQPGDILLMRFTGDPQHLAFYAGYSPVYQAEGIIHALFQGSRKNSRVCEHILSDDWRSRIVRIYRFTGVES